MGLIGVGIAIWLGVSEEVRMLESAGPGSGDIFEELDAIANPEIASPGVGVYVAGIGALLVFFGGLTRRSEREE